MKKQINKIKYFDAHSHLHSDFFNKKENGQEVAEKMADEGICSTIIGVDFVDSEKAVQMAQKNENLFCAIGQHPLDNPSEIWDEKKYQKLIYEDNTEQEILNIFEKNKHKTICVVATTSTGKSTMIKKIGVGVDMDDIVFKNLSSDEKGYVRNKEWSQDIGDFMEKRSKEIIVIKKGEPVFGTIVYDTDIVIYLDIDDGILKSRVKKRGVKIESALKMKEWIEKKVDKTNAEVIKLKIRQKKVVCVGECGLDYYWPSLDKKKGKISESDFENEKKRQKKLFENQIDFAVKNELPLMLHIRSYENADAHRDAFEILDKKQKEHKGKIRADFHFFTEGPEIVAEIIKRGFMISLPGVITFADLDKSILEAPMESIMSETDSPFAAPKPFRGKTNTPLYVPEIVKKIAEVKKLSIEEVRKKTVENAIGFFGIKYLD